MVKIDLKDIPCVRGKMVNVFLCCSFKYFHILDVWLAIFEYLGRNGALHKWSNALIMRQSSTELTPLWQLYF